MIFPHYKQLDVMDCGPTCLRMIAKFYKKNLSLIQLRKLSEYNLDGVSMLGNICRAFLFLFTILLRTYAILFLKHGREILRGIESTLVGDFVDIGRLIF